MKKKVKQIKPYHKGQEVTIILPVVEITEDLDYFKVFVGWNKYFKEGIVSKLMPTAYRTRVINKMFADFLKECCMEGKPYKVTPPV